MSELDFEELDRAVSSLMQETGEPATTPVATGSPASAAPDTAATSTTPTSAPVAPNPAARRRGQFMDVVHPSSNMRAPAPVSREGKDVGVAEATEAQPQPATPPTPVPTPAVPEVESTESFKVELPDVPEKTVEAEPNPLGDTNTTPAIETAPEPVVDLGQTPVESATEASKIEWPDPIDVMTEKTQDSAEAVTSPEGDTASPEAVADTDSVPSQSELPKAEEKTDQSEPEKPMGSPFLPDAKVEKRPLGSPVTDSPAPEIALPGELGEDKPKSPPLPEELSGDIMKVEATTPTTHESTTPEPIKASGAINQQYAEQPSTGDQTNGPIYDTANYHKAVAHPDKKKSGWSWVVWIVVLLVLGAAAGAAYFYFTT